MPHLRRCSNGLKQVLDMLVQWWKDQWLKNIGAEGDLKGNHGDAVLILILEVEGEQSEEKGTEESDGESDEDIAGVDLEEVRRKPLGVTAACGQNT